MALRSLRIKNNGRGLSHAGATTGREGSWEESQAPTDVHTGAQEGTTLASAPVLPVLTGSLRTGHVGRGSRLGGGNEKG